MEYHIRTFIAKNKIAILLFALTSILFIFCLFYSPQALTITEDDAVEVVMDLTGNSVENLDQVNVKEEANKFIVSFQKKNTIYTYFLEKNGIVQDTRKEKAVEIQSSGISTQASTENNATKNDKEPVQTNDVVSDEFLLSNSYNYLGVQWYDVQNAYVEKKEDGNYLVTGFHPDYDTFYVTITPEGQILEALKTKRE